MVDEKTNEKNETTKIIETTPDKVIVSDKELENIEQEIVDKDRANEQTLKTEIEEKVRKEMETEQKLKDLESDKIKLEATIAKQAKEKEELTKKKDEELIEVKKEIGSSKAIVPNNSPFQQTEEEKSKDYGTELSSDQVQEVEEKSKEEFLKSMGLSESQWSGGTRK